MNKKTVLDELQPFVKVPTPEEAARIELGQKRAQFIADVITADLSLTQSRALCEARGLSMDDLMMANRVNNALSEFKSDARINVKKVELYKAKVEAQDPMFDIELRRMSNMVENEPALWDKSWMRVVVQRWCKKMDTQKK